MSVYKVIILEQAISEIADSCLYYNKKVPGLGFDFEDAVFQLLELIKDNPLLFPVKFAHIHEAVVVRFPFVITYEILGKQVIVTAVFHVKRNPVKKTKRKQK